MSRLRFALLLLPVALLLMAFHQAPLVNPPSIAVPPKDTPDQVNKSIRAALLSGQWLVTANNPGEIDGTLARNDYSANIAVSYDDKKIQIRYVDSSNLKYEKKNGVEYIHRNYLVWIRDLAAQIQSNLLLFGS
ncbi:MAG TPA: hypothetical protein VFF05_09840 [Rudaea sp.]|nr:hypothetical protein [Rudaea sp.]